MPVRKKGFWFFSIWLSIPCIIFPPFIFAYLGGRSVDRTTEAIADHTGNISHSHLDAMQDGVNSALIYFTAGMAIPVLAVIWLIVSIACHLKQPRKLV